MKTANIYRADGNMGYAVVATLTGTTEAILAMFDLIKLPGQWLGACLVKR